MIIGVRDDNQISMSGLLSTTHAVIVNTGDCCPNRQYYLHTVRKGAVVKSAGEENRAGGSAAMRAEMRA